MRDRRLDRVQGGRRGAGVASHLSAPSPNPQPTAHLPAESISASAFPHLRADYSCPRAGRARSGGNDDSLDVTQHAHLDCIFRLVAEEMRRLDAAVATLQEVGHGRRAEILAGVQVGPPWDPDLASAPCVGLLLTSHGCAGLGGAYSGGIVGSRAAHPAQRPQASGCRRQLARRRSGAPLTILLEPSAPSPAGASAAACTQ